VTIHVNIGEAKTQLSKLLAAAKRGEEVVITRDGTPEVRLVPVDRSWQKKLIAEERRRAFGRFAGEASKEALDDIARPAFSDEEMKGFGLLPGEDPGA
jgi:prevent-host-death family protein